MRQTKNEETKIWLERVKEALYAEGFRNPGLLQIWEPNQLFGLVKDISNIYQMHVRGFADGRLKPHIELSLWYLQHLTHPSRPATKELAEILKSYNIPYRIIEDEQKIYVEIEPPETLTDWRPLAVVTGILGAALLTAYLLSKSR